MKCTLLYGTLSGSTMTAAGIVSDVLTAAGHQVDTIMVDGATKDQIKDSQLVIFGSPSWEDEGKDGQPLPDMTKFLKTLTAEDLDGKKIAIFGLGDTSYQHFCGAVDVMTELLKTLKAASIIEPLRVDRYYSLPDNETKTRQWADTLAKSL